MSSIDRFEARNYKDSSGLELPYRLFIPPTYDSSQSYPLVLFLHGSGERGEDNIAQIRGGAAPWTEPGAQASDPFFLVAPQCPISDQWSDGIRSGDTTGSPTNALRLALATVDALQHEFCVDADRIYITGLSMGGYGTWEAIIRFPDRFAAAVPICGGGPPKLASRAVNVPVWAFHGDADPVVPVQRTRDMIAALREAGGHPNYSELPGVDHNSWDAAYADPETLRWLLSNRRGANVPPAS